MAQPWWLADLWQPFKWTRQATSAHSGVDKGMPCGTPVVVPVDGTVINSGPQPWGGQVDVQVKPGELPPPYDQSSPYVISFLHLSREDVKPGPVTAGQQIGLSGQPPPGAGFGSGCHLHVETTHGSTPPYTGYSPWHPTSTNYPEDAQPLISFLGVNGPASSTSTAWRAHPLSYGISGGTGASNLDSSTSGGTSSPSTWQQILAGAASQLPVIGPALQTDILGGNFYGLGSQFGWILGWVTNPLRIGKVVLGMMLIGMAVWIAFRPEIAAGITAAAGAPEAAGAVYQAAGGGRNRFGSIGRAKTPEQRFIAQQQRQQQRQQQQAGLSGIGRSQVRPRAAGPISSPTPVGPSGPPQPRRRNGTGADTRTILRQQAAAAGAASNVRERHREESARAAARPQQGSLFPKDVPGKMQSGDYGTFMGSGKTLDELIADLANPGKYGRK